MSGLSQSEFAKYWCYVKSKDQTITGTWNFTGLQVNGSPVLTTDDLSDITPVDDTLLVHKANNENLTGAKTALYPANFSVTHSDGSKVVYGGQGPVFPLNSYIIYGQAPANYMIYNTKVAHNFFLENNPVVDGNPVFGIGRIDPLSSVISSNIFAYNKLQLISGITGALPASTTPVSFIVQDVNSDFQTIPYTPTLRAQAFLDFPSTNAQSSSRLTVNVPGAVDGDPVSIGVPYESYSNSSCYTAFVSSAGVVTVQFNNYSNSPIDPANSNFSIIVFK